MVPNALYSTRTKILRNDGGGGKDDPQHHEVEGSQMLNPMAMAARSLSPNRAAMMVSTTPVPICAVCAISSGQPIRQNWLSSARSVGVG